jgi:chromosome segregation ATPase
MARKRELELEGLRLQLQLEVAERDRDRLQSERNDFAERANTLEWSLRAATDREKDLQEKVVELDKAKAVLMERLELVSLGIGQSTPEPTALPYPTKHEPEEIEDARYALEAGRIDRGQFNEILTQYGFSNTEVEIAGDGTPQF